MQNNYKVGAPFEKTLLQFVGIIAIAFGFVFLYSGIGGFIIKALSDIDPTELDRLNAVQREDLKNVYLLGQFTGFFIGLVVFPALYLYFLKPSFHVFKVQTRQLSTFILLSLLMIFAIIPIINVINEWNQSLHLPSAFSSTEMKLKEMETQAEKAINLIIYYQNLTQFFIILVVIAILPAIGEELLFRGIVQNEFKTLFRNPHIAIWGAAFLFSFIHFQFFGFFPRLLLGVILGYFYYWSGNILVSMFLHFMNNAITLIGMNLIHQKNITFDPNSAKGIPVAYIIFSFTISMVLLYIFWKTYKQNSEIGGDA